MYKLAQTFIGKIHEAISGMPYKKSGSLATKSLHITMTVKEGQCFTLACTYMGRWLGGMMAPNPSCSAPGSQLPTAALLAGKATCPGWAAGASASDAA